MSIEPEQNRRQTHINSINRVKVFVQSEKFNEASAAEIEQKSEFLENSYIKFMEEHQNLIHFLPKSEFKKEDDKFASVEEIYQKIKLKIRQRANELEIKATIERQNKMSGKNDVQQVEADTCSEDTVEEKIDEQLKIAAHRVIVDRRSEDAEREDLRNQLARKRSADQSPRAVQSTVHRMFRSIVCHNCRAHTHPMFKCYAFKALDIAQRRDRVNVLGLCENCLQPKERSRAHRCRGGSCWRCGLFHNSLLCSRAVK